MSRNLLFFISTVLLSVSAAAQSAVFTSEDIVLDIDVSSRMMIMPTSSDYRTDYVRAELVFYPREDKRQEIISLETEPKAERDKQTLVFQWDEPTQRDFDFTVSSRIRTKNVLDKIRSKVRFPITNIDDDLYYYTQPGGTIDINQDIRNLASSLAEGEDDLYQVVFNIARWVKTNIEYDLSTVTATAVQKSSWVLDNRQGVCDELTNLFIAMVRSLGIPARFVTGISYTDSDLFDENWGLHGWAEVYFPEYGWVPFDVTYGEMGFVDAGHIKLTESVDSNKSTTRYEWKGVHVDLETSKLDIQTDVVELGRKMDPLLTIETDIHKRSVGFGSYNLIEATVKNDHNYYVPTEVFISRSNGYELVGENRKPILLAPNERTRVFWVIRVNDDLEDEFVYTFNVAAYTTRNATSEKVFTASPDEDVYSLEEIDDILDIKKESVKKTYSREVALLCDTKEDSVGLGEEILITCTLQNTGNTFMDDLAVCLDDECSEISLAINQEEQIMFTKTFSETGSKDLQVTAKNDEISKVDFVKVVALDEPKISLSELEFPDSVSYEEKYTISFVLKKDSLAVPKDIVVRVKQGALSKTWEFDELNSERKFILNLNSVELYSEDNPFELLVTYQDDEGEEFVTRENFSVALTDITAVHKAGMMLRRMSSGMNTYYTLIVLSAVIFGLILGVVFKGRKKKPEDYW